MTYKKIISISQPRYLPALNYIQRMVHSDIFILLESVQRQARAWENRNKLLIPDEKWLTIPIKSSSRSLISNTFTDGQKWLENHKKIIKQHYAKCKFYDEDILNEYYKNMNSSKDNNLSFQEIAFSSINSLSKILDISINPIRENDINNDKSLTGGEKILNICECLQGSTYISGPNGANYKIHDFFKNSGIAVKYHFYKPTKYTHLNQEKFFPLLGFFDPLFNMGHKWTRKEIFKKPHFSNEPSNFKL